MTSSSHVFQVDVVDDQIFLEADPNADIGYGEEFAEAAEAAGIDAIGLQKR
jgi:hypothetical protein